MEDEGPEVLDEFVIELEAPGRVAEVEVELELGVVLVGSRKIGLPMRILVLGLAVCELPMKRQCYLSFN